MLLLMFDVRGCRYAVDVRQVVEVVPAIPLRPVPHGPAYLAGLFNHAGAVVPVVDLGIRLGGTPCATRLSTRILVVGLDAAGPGGRPARLGLIAEHVTELVPIADDRLAPRADGPEDAPYLGPVVQVEDELVQVLYPDAILPERLHAELFGVMLG